MTPNLIPRFRSFKDLADLINTSLDDAGYGSITVEFIYIPKPDGETEEQPRFEVFIEFSTTLSVSVGLDATYEVSFTFGIHISAWINYMPAHTPVDSLFLSYIL